jgi:N-acetylneuraminate synthase
VITDLLKKVVEDVGKSSLYFIAEAGINHNGDLDKALKLVKMAFDAGCDAVKFQKREPLVCVPVHMRDQIRETPWGEITYLEYKQKIEFGKSEYDEIDSYCRKLKLEWSASAWDLPSLEFLDQYDLPFNKVASALTTNLEFLGEVAKRKKLTYVSVGMCSYEDIDRAAAIFENEKCPIVLMHTISNYPASESDLNLKMIGTLSERYNLPIGYSGHESSLTPSIVAATLGAKAIERHITLDRSMWGTDHAASLEFSGLSNLVGSLRKIDVVLGDGVKREIPGEKEIAKKMRYWENT